MGILNLQTMTWFLGPGDFQFVILEGCLQNSSSVFDICQFISQPYEQREAERNMVYSRSVCCSCTLIKLLHHLQVHIVNGLWIRWRDLEADSWECLRWAIRGDNVPVLRVCVGFQGELLPSGHGALNDNDRLQIWNSCRSGAHCLLFILWTPDDSFRSGSATLSVSQSHSDSTVTGLLRLVRRCLRGAMLVLRLLRSDSCCSQFCTAVSSVWWETHADEKCLSYGC